MNVIYGQRKGDMVRIQGFEGETVLVTVADVDGPKSDRTVALRFQGLGEIVEISDLCEADGRVEVGFFFLRIFPTTRQGNSVGVEYTVPEGYSVNTINSAGKHQHRALRQQQPAIYS